MNADYSQFRCLLTGPAESKPKRRMTSTKTTGVRLIGKKSPGQRRQAELRSTDSRRQTRKRRSSLSLALLDLSSRYFLKHSNKDISRNVKFFRHALSAVGRSVRCQAVSASNPRPEIRCDQANQWAEHCESNSDARDQRSGKMLIGRARHALQTQFPSSGIELRGCDQLGLRSLHVTYLKGWKVDISQNVNFLLYALSGVHTTTAPQCWSLKARRRFV
jgi:hypothetical protein